MVPVNRYRGFSNPDRAHDDAGDVNLELAIDEPDAASAIQQRLERHAGGRR